MEQFTRLHRAMLKITRADPGCRRLIIALGVGALVAIAYRSAVDDSRRFERSSPGAYFGLMPKKYQSGETDFNCGVTKVGDTMVRTTLYEVAHIMLTRASQFSTLQRWAIDMTKRRVLNEQRWRWLANLQLSFTACGLTLLSPAFEMLAAQFSSILLKGQCNALHFWQSFSLIFSKRPIEAVCDWASKIVDGTACSMDDKDFCWHAWIEFDGWIGCQ